MQTAPLFNAKSGFSLVEVTLAMMVVAIGILAVMSLFTAGLEQNARSIADTRIALFGEEVMNSLQALANEALIKKNWEADWDDLPNELIPLAVSEAWDSTLTDIERANNWPHPRTNLYKLSSSFQSGGGSPLIEKYALRYSLDISSNVTPPALTATLWVWSGEFGTTNNPVIFHREFFKPKHSHSSYPPASY